MKPTMNTEDHKPSDASHNASETRRRLIRGGLLAGPVLFALKSTPVLAANCKQPSGFSTSGNLSRNAGASCADPAKGPSYWQNAVDSDNRFTGTGISRKALFNSVFQGSDSRKMVTVLRSGTGFASLLVAAYLDVKASRFVPGVTTTHLQQMWSGNFRPPGTTNNWSAAESENYLRYSMGLPLINF